MLILKGGRKRKQPPPALNLEHPARHYNPTYSISTPASLKRLIPNGLLEINSLQGNDWEHGLQSPRLPQVHLWLCYLLAGWPWTVTDPLCTSVSPLKWRSSQNHLRGLLWEMSLSMWHLSAVLEGWCHLLVVVVTEQFRSQSQPEHAELSETSGEAGLNRPMKTPV